jgi:histidinol-phosphatase
MPTPSPALSTREVRALLPRVFAALADADKITLGYLHRARVQHKADGTEVTSADRGAERVLRRHLADGWPNDPVLGEEYGGALGSRGRCWLIDPIDGTASYVLGTPMFGTLISLVIDGEPVFGCIHLPALGETTYAALGHGCWLRRGGSRPKRVRVGAPRPLREAEVGLTNFRDSDLAPQPGPWQLSRLARSVGRVRLVGDCVQYALLCRGLLDGAIDPRMNPWDIGALVPCIREAGGAYSDLRGERSDILRRKSFVAASSPTLLRAITRRTSD